jgi:hypothetical protein
VRTACRTKPYPEDPGAFVDEAPWPGLARGAPWYGGQAAGFSWRSRGERPGEQAARAAAHDLLAYRTSTPPSPGRRGHTGLGSPGVRGSRTIPSARSSSALQTAWSARSRTLWADERTHWQSVQ